MTDVPSTPSPQVMAFLQYSDEDFLCGVGATKEAAHAAMLEGQVVHERILRLPVSYLRMTPRSTGWSMETRDNMG